MRSFNIKMSENNSEGQFLKLREIFNETILRDVIIFVALYLFILSQSWKNIFLLLFPIVSFGFSFFFRIINTNKFRLFLRIEGAQITYNPLGLEKKHANRLNFSSIFQLILLFWIGAESFYHPQLLDAYGIFFNLAFIFFFTFGFYWVLTDIWKYAKITIELEDENLISLLSLRKFKLVAIINLINFCFINLLNLTFTIFIKNNTILSFNLPGTGIESSLPLRLSIVPFITILVSPTITIVLLFIIYKGLHSISLADLNNSLTGIPSEQRNLIIHNFEKINKKLFRDLNNE
ncbi:MAG: hypothetical protein EAX91_09140 [Candidatus Lokiarchaeota archaeon]|nr:hypothetical protein [Candidatus Lokiarchaeota archaeon]